MPISYNSIVPWGRSYEEYVKMFSLTKEDENKSILGCGDGPAGFNSIMTKNGKNVISIDPIYQFSKEEIEKRINETYKNVIDQTKKNLDRFVWTSFKDPDDLGKTRLLAMKEFLNDYELGKSQKRYVFAELPNLPFPDNKFELSLSSHFLFLYSNNLTLDFHVQAINEMLRVSKEIRIFPLVDVNADESLFVPKIISKYKQYGLIVNVKKVNYEFQKNGNKMLQIINTTNQYYKPKKIIIE